MNINLFKKAMEVGYYFKAELFDYNREWKASEECSTFTKIIVDYAEENGCDIDFAFQEIADETAKGICDKTISVDDHMWDEYCKGFLSGEILGYPNEEIMELIKVAEKLWEDAETYGYYQEVLEEVKNKQNPHFIRR